MTHKNRFRQGLLGVQGLLIYIWLTDLSQLAGTDTYYSVYLLCGAAALLSLWDNRGKAPGGLWLGIFAGVFSLAVVLGNYQLYLPLSLQNTMDMALSLAGGFCVGYQILTCLHRRLPIAADPARRQHPARVFWGMFALVAAVDLGYLLLCYYPGVLTTDSFTTLAQNLEGSYDNTMPYYHTRLVGLFLRLGLGLGSDVNLGVALFHTFQILLLAGVFGYVVMTLYQIGVPGWCLALVAAVYALVPYNIVYSITLWKDIPFGAAALLTATALYRLIQGVGSHKPREYAALCLGSFGLALLRTNGWYALAAATVLLALAMKKAGKTLLIVLLVVLLVSWVLIGPVLAALQVPETDPVEAFAVPMQQIARVVANRRPLPPEGEALLSQIFWLDSLPELYDPQTVDPVKFQALRRDQLDFLRENWSEYLRLYLRLGAEYPADYLQAWIEQTRGYWNGGYFFWIYTLKTGKNDVGVQWNIRDNPVSRGYAAWFRYLEKPEALQPLYSIGFHVWILVACCLLCGLKHRRQWLIAVPALVLTVGLWLGTPVYAEFRYAYPMILTTPFLLMTTIFHPGPGSAR